MDKKDKKGNKFNFVSSEETLEDDMVVEAETEKREVEVALDEMQIVKDAKLDEFKPIETFENNEEEILEFEFVEEEIKSEEEKNESSEKSTEIKNNNLGKKIYIGFEARVITMVLIVLCLFFGACYFILEACNFSKDRVVTYNENSKVNYSVCVNNSDYYNKSCLNEGMEYLSAITENITASFNYNVNLSTEIDYNMAYHIVGITKIYDKADNKKVFYESEDLLVERTDISDISDMINFDREVLIDYNKYNNYVKGYKDKYGIDALSSLEVILYLDEAEETRAVSSMTIPLGNDTFGIKKTAISNNDKEVKIDNDVWNEYNVICAVCASVLIILSLMVLFRVTSLVLKVTNNKTKYQMMLAHVLKEYDEMIVNTRDGYEIPANKKLIKVASFKELIDARNTLNKPILYSKINDVKSEFVVEDSEQVYRYVMKEADFLD